jgi:hypothetical protein
VIPASDQSKALPAREFSEARQDYRFDAISFTIPASGHLELLRFDPDVTFLVGKKSTLMGVMPMKVREVFT